MQLIYVDRLVWPIMYRVRGGGSVKWLKFLKHVLHVFSFLVTAQVLASIVTSRYPAAHDATLESRHRACPVSLLIQRSGLRIMLTLQREAGLLVDVMSSTERLK